MLAKDQHGCPYLMLAPMEGVGDRCFRKAMAQVGGFDEAIADFLRVPRNAHIKSLAKEYDSLEIAPFPLAAQLMGGDPALMAAMAVEIEARGATHINLNCGCPSNTVTGRGAGSSLLKTPELLHEIARAMVQAVNIPVTIKMRTGFEDTSLFKENLLAAEESGVRYIILHPRTKVDGYGPPARWDLIQVAKSILKIPLVGNGDILQVDDALRMLSMTGCDALMIGRGALINPYIFHQIRAHFAKKPYEEQPLISYFLEYLKEIPPEIAHRGKINKLKQLMSFLFKKDAKLLEKRQAMLTSSFTEIEPFVEFLKQALDHAA